MKKEDLLEALALIVDEQEQCAPVELSIGGIDGNGSVQHSTLYLKDAPPKVINALVGRGYSLSVSWQGLSVDRISI